MANPRMLAVLAAAIESDDTQWIEVMPTADKARNGPWHFTITTDDLETYAQSIRDQPSLIPVDYDHADGGSTVAAGWFTGEAQVIKTGGLTPTGDTQNRDSMWAKVKWTPQGAQDVRDGRFKRISPEFSFQNHDKKTGLMTKAKQILAATLTNRPFFRQLAPVGSQGDVVWDSSQGFSYMQQLIGAALNPGPGDYRYWVNDVMQDRALVCESGTGKAWVIAFVISDGVAQVAPQSEWVDAKQEWVQAAEAALKSGRRPSTRKDREMDTKVLAKSLGLPEDATEEQITAALDEQSKKAAKAAALETENTELKAKATEGDKTEVETLRSDLAAEKTARITEKRDGMLAKAVEDRRFDVATSEVLKAQFGENVDGLQAVIATYAPKPVGAHGSGGAGKNDDGTPAELHAVAEEFQITDDVKTIGAGEGELSLHVKAMKILADKGKHDHTASEYAAAYAEAERAIAA